MSSSWFDAPSLEYKLPKESSGLAKFLEIKQITPSAIFSDAVRRAGIEVRTSPMVSLAAYKVVDAEDSLVRLTGGKWTHHFIIATIQLKVKWEWYPKAYLTHMRVDFSKHDSGVVVTLSDNLYLLEDGARQLGKLASPSGQVVDTGPSLDALARLLHVMTQRPHQYSVTGRNCHWHTENLLFAMALRFASHWEKGDVTPAALVDYVMGKINVLKCAAALLTDDPAVQWWDRFGRRDSARFPGSI